MNTCLSRYTFLHSLSDRVSGWLRLILVAVRQLGQSLMTATSSASQAPSSVTFCLSRSHLAAGPVKLGSQSMEAEHRMRNADLDQAAVLRPSPEAHRNLQHSNMSLPFRGVHHLAKLIKRWEFTLLWMLRVAWGECITMIILCQHWWVSLQYMRRHLMIRFLSNCDDHSRLSHSRWQCQAERRLRHTAATITST